MAFRTLMSLASPNRRGVRRRQTSQQRCAAPAYAHRAVEPLEPRQLMTVGIAFDALVNASHADANQTETAIAINRTNPNQLFASSNNGAFHEPDTGPNDPIRERGIFTSHSEDGGVTWNTRLVAADVNNDAISDDGFPIACCDPSVAYDEFGNLFFAYLAIHPVTDAHSVVVLLSTDNGQTFTMIADFHGAGDLVDRCEVVTGAGQVWVTYVDFAVTSPTGGQGPSEMAVGAPVTGLGQVGAFIEPQMLPQSGPASGGTVQPNIGHAAIGPNGEVIATYQLTDDKAAIYTNTDPDGLGPQPFGNAVFVDVGDLSFFEPIPGQSARGLTVVPTLAWDRSNGPHRGRVYISYTKELTNDRTGSDGVPISHTGDSDVLLRFSDDNGATWSPAIRVNDDPPSSQTSQFYQRVVVDQTTGVIAVGWLDTRDNPNGPGANQLVGYYLTVGESAGNGVNFAPNVRLNVGPSNARLSGNTTNDYGDYTGLDMFNGVIWAAYPDNSNSTGDNPSGRLRAFDFYAARVHVTPDTTPVEPPFVTPASPLAPTPVKPLSLVRRGRSFTLRVSYTNASGIDLATVGDNDLVVTGPNGFSQSMQLRRAARRARGTNVRATYRLAAPGGTWDTAENGVYTVTLQPGAVTATNGTATTAGTLTKFVVNVPPPGARRGRREIDSPSADYHPRARRGNDEPRGGAATSLLSEH